MGAGVCKIGEGDVDWREVRAALAETKFTGWYTVEVAGGEYKRLEDVAGTIGKHLIGN